MFLRDTNQASCCARGFARSLLPFLQRAHGNPKQNRELCLAKPACVARAYHSGKLDAGFARGLAGLHLPDAAQKILIERLHFPVSFFL